MFIHRRKVVIYIVQQQLNPSVHMRAMPLFLGVFNPSGVIWLPRVPMDPRFEGSNPDEDGRFLGVIKACRTPFFRG
jgi:hypothetical protein